MFNTGFPKRWSTLRKLLCLRIMQGAAAVLQTVTGNAPLTLANAVAKDIKRLTQTGLCAQASTPTPSAPVDIKCNNGVLKMVHQSGLPSDYKLLEYVGGSGSQYIVTDLYLASTDVIECEYRNSSTTGYGAIYGIYKNGESSALYGNQTYYGYNEGNNKVDTGVSVDTDWHSSRHDFVNGTLTIDETTVNFTPWTFVNTTKNGVLTRFYNGSYGYHWKGYVRKFKVTRGGTVICDLLPAKNSDGDAGLYDLVSGNFYTASGGTLLEGNVIDDYYLAVVGTPEVLTVRGPNQLSRDGETTGYIITAKGNVSENASYCISAPFTLSAGNYVCTWQTGSGSRPFSVFAVDESGTPQSDGKLFYQQSATAGINTGEFTVEAETLVVASYRNNVKELAIYSSQTATVPTLLSVGDVKDEAEIISGLVTRRVTACLYDGTQPVGDVYMSTTGGKDAGAIIVYPLATPTTEQTTAQPLNTSEGTNTVSVTAEVSPVALSCEYYQAAA